MTLNGEAIRTDIVDRPNTDVVDRPFKLGGQHVICHLGGTYENKSVNIKFIYISSVNIFFLFQETPVNKNIQVIEASGRGSYSGHINPMNCVWFFLICGI